jgi:16S rRNA (uracil1498-N3)-methyltransferase
LTSASFPDAGAAALVYVDTLRDRCEIDGDDGHHLERVRRLRVGERVDAADGAGTWRPYEIVETRRGCVVLEARGVAQREPQPTFPIALAVALQKGGLEAVVASVTELGVARIVPVRTARAVVRWDEARGAAAVRRLRVVAREAGMQSRRARLPDVDGVTDLAALVATPGLVIADRGGAPAGELGAPGPSGWTVLVGPEGGLAPEELGLLGGVTTLSLGPHVLRAATAPIAAVAVLLDQVRRIGPLGGPQMRPE